MDPRGHIKDQVPEAEALRAEDLPGDRHTPQVPRGHCGREAGKSCRVGSRHKGLQQGTALLQGTNGQASRQGGQEH